MSDTATWIKDLSVRSETIKRLRKRIGKKLLVVSISHDFGAITAKTQGKKAKVDTWDYIN